MKNDKELIEKLGGPAKLAHKLGFTVQRVQNWTVRGIPAQVKLDHPDLFLIPAPQASTRATAPSFDESDPHSRDTFLMSAHPS
ncbi:YdaS family helix-turn-helix protein [Massilia sp. DD77]